MVSEMGCIFIAEYHHQNKQQFFAKRMPTALGILELSPTSILTKLDRACLLNSTGIRKFHDDVAVDIICSDCRCQKLPEENLI
jgi:hypothetical protein